MKAELVARVIRAGEEFLDEGVVEEEVSGLDGSPARERRDALIRKQFWRQG
jgi:hypothetical protein